VISRLQRARATAALVVSTFLAAGVHAQSPTSGPTVWIGSPIEEYARVLQLTGVMPLSSQMIRPTSAPINWVAPDTASWRAPWRGLENRDSTREWRGVGVRVLEPYTQVTYNMAFPSGTNDGVMWAGRGFSVAQTLGARVTWRGVTLDVAPTYTWSQNQRFTLGPQYITKALSSPYADQYNGLGIDQPQRFGDSPVSVVDAGQSGLMVEGKGVRAGIAKQNMWWGPGIDDALIMTNNAPGFRHAFVGTQRPLSIGIGRLEALWTVGRLTQTQFWRLPGDTTATDRWLDAVTLVFEPRGAPGLYFGATRLFYAYERYNPIDFNEIRTLFQTFKKSALSDSANPFGNDTRDQMLSLNFRWIVPRAGFEVYGEWGRNDHSWDWRDLFLQPDHSQAKVLGARKIVRAGDGILSIRLESTTLSNTLAYITRATPVWYMHHIVQQGFTENGQVIGAGSGPGSEQQTLAVDWFRPSGRLGWLLQRQRGNNDGLYRAGILDFFRIDGALLTGPRVTVFAGPVQLDAIYEFQHELNRYSIANADASNHRIEVHAQLRVR